jgi:hypothetical protein
MLVADAICRDAVGGEGDRMVVANEAATSYVFHATIDYPMLVAGDFPPCHMEHGHSPGLILITT